jgi:pyridoxine 5-phosphate synthase
MTLLSVNVNKIALLRNSRAGKGPEVVPLARIALEEGAAGITIHPRPDQRHITKRDVSEIAALLAEPRWRQAKRELNIEGNPFEGDWMAIVRRAAPDQATLVPDAPGQSTSDHGFDMPADIDRLQPVISRLKQAGCRVSVFMDPQPEAMRHMPATGADRIELYTESYADAFARRDLDPSHFQQTLRRFVDCARAAADAGLGVNAGHDLNLQNLPDFVAAIGPEVLLEVSIGHALIGDALRHGMGQTVRNYLLALRAAETGHA